MKIVILSDRIPPENRGGAGVVTWRLAQALHAAGHDLHVIAATAGQPFTEQRDGLPTYHLHSRYPERWRAYLSLYNPQTVRPLRRLLAQLRPDVVNAHNIHTDLSYAALTLARRAGIPTVFSAHDVMPFAYHKLSYFIDPMHCGVRSTQAYRLPVGFNWRQMRLRYNPLRNWVIRRIVTQDATLRTAPSTELAHALAANDLPPFETVHNGIDLAAWQASPQVVDALRARLGLQGRKIILFAGRLTRAKGTQQVLQALLRVVPAVPEALLLVLSSANMDAQIADSAFADLKARHMRVAGWLTGEELSAAYALADVVVVPSIVFDTFPTVNLEAMAAGKPVLATCYGGSREAVMDRETGYIINPFDIADVAAKLTQVLQDDALRQRMGQAGRKRVAAAFTLEAQATRMVQLYQQAMDLWQARPGA